MSHGDGRETRVSWRADRGRIDGTASGPRRRGLASAQEGLDMEPSNAARVLLVDDQPKNLLALEAVLGGLGLDLIRAARTISRVELVEASGLTRLVRLVGVAVNVKVDRGAFSFSPPRNVRVVDQRAMGG